MPQVEILGHRLPIVAIVGRPNVGKSTMFNRIVGRRKAVVLDTPGLTRDRNFETAEWNGRAFMLVDTGGYETDPRDNIYAQMRRQSLLAMEEADVVVFLTDVTEPDNPVDRDVADLLRRASKPTVLAVNKCDTNRRHQESYAFYSLGFDPLYALSALNGSGMGDLMDRIVELLPEEEPAPETSQEGPKPIRIAIVGRPNVGKSSIVNALLERERVIVDDTPGTTRDSIDTAFRYGDRVYTIVDTAGMRRRGKIERGAEKLSVFAAQAGLSRCDVAVIVIDASEGLTEQDQHVAGYALEANRGCVLVLNKWDLIEKENSTAGTFAKKLRDEMPYLSFAPIVMTSATTGQRVKRILELVDRVHAEYCREIDTPTLNKWLEETTHRVSPPWHKGRQLSLKYVTQTGTRPPRFTFFVNNPRLLHFSYRRYLANQLREAFGFEGVAFQMTFRAKSRDKSSEEA
ncbi:ribosome biogenesis GTPase Der [Candidatus Sumerlaeota bacterium]|nr:ribosome biogenesis GTPase Der [Candidatus Sumerlaeota bacterium]